ncbi:MAG: hypothetical protein NWR72_05495 [Bacteroidia bacterium]|nr:hypothetical protein [Bacteroidia bacterium]
MELLTNILLLLHVIAGSTALLSGLIPMFAKKGSRLHVIGGKVYVWAMYGVVFTALPVALIRNSVFLGTLGVFVGYLIYTGQRTAKRRSVVPSSTMDKAIMWTTMVVSVVMLATAIYFAIGPKWGTGIVLAVFGSICLLAAVEDYRATRLPEGQPERPWLLLHLSRFGGAYIATFTAFAVTNVQFMPPLLVWLTPTLIGTMIISRTSRYWRKKLTKSL